MGPEKPAFFENKAEWRRWLQKNHETATEIWILAYKVHTGRRCLTYAEALDEALCYGWIDSRLKRIDDEKHMWRFAPRKPNSIWSLNNRRHAERLIREGRMTRFGLERIEDGKRSGKWQEAIAPSIPPKMPDELLAALKKNKVAWKKFNSLARSYQTQFIYWVILAKREETRQRRIREVVRKVAKGLKTSYIGEERGF